MTRFKIYHNRDKNAVQNMISIVEELKKTGKDLYDLLEKS